MRSEWDLTTPRDKIEICILLYSETHGQLVTLLLLLSNERLFETEAAKQDWRRHEHQQSYNAGIYLD